MFTEESLVLWGSACFGAVVGWLAYHVFKRASKVDIRWLGSIVAVLGGGAVTALFEKKSQMFGCYCIGLGVSFFLGVVLVPFSEALARWFASRRRDMASTDAVVHDPVSQGPFDKEKIAQIFWLGADLHSLIWHLNATGDSVKIRFYLKQANSHMKLAGLNGHPLQEIMARLNQEGRKKSASDWTSSVRHQYVQAVASLLTKIVALIEHQQGSSFVGEVPDVP